MRAGDESEAGKVIRWLLTLQVVSEQCFVDLQSCAQLIMLQVEMFAVRSGDVKTVETLSKPSRKTRQSSDMGSEFENNLGEVKAGSSKDGGESNEAGNVEGAEVSEGAASMVECSSKADSSKAGLEPFSFDEEKLAEKYRETPDHLCSIKSFPRRTFNMFYRLKDRIPMSKNTRFLQSLFNTKNAEETVSAFQLT